MAANESDALEPLTLSQAHTVVLVDDEPQVLAALRRVLREEPYEVRTTSSPRDALDWVGQGGVSLLITDQRMPDLCGTELAEQVRRISPRTARILLTAYPGNALVRHGLAGDVEWLLSKPWNDDALRVTIRRLLRDLESVPRPPETPATGAVGPEHPKDPLPQRELWSGPAREAIRPALEGFIGTAETGGC